jgi:hypothetical protein
MLQEKRITKSLTEIGDAAKRQIASGALWLAKSDVVSNMFRVEAKTRVNPSKTMTVHKEWHDKILAEALETNKIGVLVYSFGDGKNYYSLEQRDFLALMEELIELRKKVAGDE